MELLKKMTSTPLDRAKIEIFEETGIREEEIELLKEVKQMKIESLNIKIMNGIFFHFYLKQKIPNQT